MDYAALAGAAAALITEFGQPATLRRVVSLGYDPGLLITVDATGKTFTRSSGSWVTDGFVAGDTVVFSGFDDAGNNAGFVASTVADLVLTCTTATGLVAVVDAAGVVASATRDTVCDVLEQDINGLRVFADSLVPGSLINESSRFFMLSGGTPQTSDKLIIGTTEYVVEAARPLSPGAVVIYWTVRVKA